MSNSTLNVSGTEAWLVLIYTSCITLRTLDHGHYGIFLIMGNGGFISSTVAFVGRWGLGCLVSISIFGNQGSKCEKVEGCGFMAAFCNPSHPTPASKKSPTSSALKP